MVRPYEGCILGGGGRASLGEGRGLCEGVRGALDGRCRSGATAGELWRRKHAVDCDREGERRRGIARAVARALVSGGAGERVGELGASAPWHIRGRRGSRDMGAALDGGLGRGWLRARRGADEAQLRGTVDLLVALHSRFWEKRWRGRPELYTSTETVTRAAQSSPASVIAAHAATVREEAARFREEQGRELTAADVGLLERLMDSWEERFTARGADGKAVTLIHGDFTFSATSSSPLDLRGREQSTGRR